ncbi:putative ATP-dependent RNA helicase DHX34 [Platysternon megacephalum]|uniref:Putative ATP-dependent RNA helicase DHX34 n=1 Tax=Platysternon megacephalum TaxID=55544 RepID=A0A4D9DLH3_9SAUR|nr:putative ATP-dependent RNA helicase DHX34 [Platysternon megacephalum]
MKLRNYLSGFQISPQRTVHLIHNPTPGFVFVCLGFFCSLLKILKYAMCNKRHTIHTSFLKCLETHTKCHTMLSLTRVAKALSFPHPHSHAYIHMCTTMQIIFQCPLHSSRNLANERSYTTCIFGEREQTEKQAGEEENKNLPMEAVMTEIRAVENFIGERNNKELPSAEPISLHSFFALKEGSRQASYSSKQRLQQKYSPYNPAVPSHFLFPMQ